MNKAIKELVYHSLVLSTSAMLVFMSGSVTFFTVRGIAVRVVLEHPFEMYVEFPAMLAMSVAAFVWTLIRIITLRKNVGRTQ